MKAIEALHYYDKAISYRLVWVVDSLFGARSTPRYFLRHRGLFHRQVAVQLHHSIASIARALIVKYYKEACAR